MEFLHRDSCSESLLSSKMSRTIVAETMGPIPGSADSIPLPSSLWELDGAMFVFRWLYSMRKYEEEMRSLLCPHLGRMSWAEDLFMSGQGAQ